MSEYRKHLEISPSDYFRVFIIIIMTRIQSKRYSFEIRIPLNPGHSGLDFIKIGNSYHIHTKNDLFSNRHVRVWHELGSQILKFKSFWSIWDFYFTSWADFRVVGHRIFKISNFNKRLIQAQKLIFLIFFSPDSDYSLNFTISLNWK
jgi:hypothetical protein